MTEPTPQDAPRSIPSAPPAPTASAPPAPPASAPPASAPPAPPASAPPAPPASAPPAPAPTGPSWGVVLVGAFFLLVAAGVVANQAAGFELWRVTEVGPGLLVAAGVTLAVLGVVGMVLRRR